MINGEKQGLRVLIAEPEGFTRAGLRHCLETWPGGAQVSEAADSEQAVALAERSRPDVLICDIDLMPHGGIDVVMHLRDTLRAEAPIALLLGRRLTNDQLMAALAARADGIVDKSAPPEVLFAALNAARQGNVFLSSPFTTQLFKNFILLPAATGDAAAKIAAALTKREFAVLCLIAQGMSNLEIASRLNLAEATVKSYSSHVFEKLGVRGRVQAALVAVGAGIASAALGHPVLAGT
ncbi:response regulator transcription factor [Actinoplanes oblitus]|uniref:Response regulator transcription factor n=1 Tax=Actinoplanes oblitus TaxID=3040509 RepID=A0ABY8WBT7_9ACTN|nr:response regulator transcription factor [Actinoplanes oblitus]WIM94407.1 response regulator transcription factor [Actinoplanes oblitus]